MCSLVRTHIYTCIRTYQSTTLLVSFFLLPLARWYCLYIGMCLLNVSGVDISVRQEFQRGFPQLVDFLKSPLASTIDNTCSVVYKLLLDRTSTYLSCDSHSCIFSCSLFTLYVVVFHSVTSLCFFLLSVCCLYARIFPCASIELLNYISLSAAMDNSFYEAGGVDALACIVANAEASIRRIMDVLYRLSRTGDGNGLGVFRSLYRASILCNQNRDFVRHLLC